MAKSKSFSSAASDFWNKLPVHLSSIPTLPAFRKRLKHHLFLDAFPGIAPSSRNGTPVGNITLSDATSLINITQAETSRRLAKSVPAERLRLVEWFTHVDYILAPYKYCVYYYYYYYTDICLSVAEIRKIWTRQALTIVTTFVAERDFIKVYRIKFEWSLLFSCWNVRSYAVFNSFFNLSYLSLFTVELIIDICLSILGFVWFNISVTWVWDVFSGFNNLMMEVFDFFSSWQRFRKRFRTAKKLSSLFPIYLPKGACGDADNYFLSEHCSRMNWSNKIVNRVPRRPGTCVSPSFDLSLSCKGSIWFGVV